ncbi:uncharacterized protein A1O9_12832 [Exophiala aquamarina CBS 119918]|uniref:3-oxoacyl-[acyl-carrier-protein] reductase n=1 Tax=Exophiala aquamarina CBS 119918 TaxID=1182545 RepID=A0A072NTA1_9EURO|nr:uncharacterized protein A1O9_12832 [Exophiala aquamarina CBS 119918]KEF51109.1 hypothetical protein A1O9_12832 [Exophiala aquamarina CBS 119918]
MVSCAIYPDLAGKVALIMGIGQVGSTQSKIWGNGAAIANVLCQNKVKVFGCDRDIAAAEFTARRLRVMDGTCDVTAADVTKLADVQKVVHAVMQKYGRIDILVNNVGMTAPGDPVSLSEDIWDKQYEVNLKSVYLSCHVVLPIMEKQGSGSVVNNASIAGLRHLGKPPSGLQLRKSSRYPSHKGNWRAIRWQRDTNEFSGAGVDIHAIG